jgi:hypothetical protein
VIQIVSNSNPLPNRNDLDLLATSYALQYQNAVPFPSIVIEDFFDKSLLDAVLLEFPDLSGIKAEEYRNKREIKLQGKGERFFGDETKRLMHFLNSEVFLDFLQTLTGIEERLIGDPYFIGGGQHETKTDGFLKIHADFNKHKTLGLDRRINVLIYLNKDWKEEYGGHFELWDRNMENCVKKVRPDFNTIAIFSTTDFSYHGLPDPLSCPENMSRKSLALYYYSNGRPNSEIIPGNQVHGTIFKARTDNASDRAALNALNDPKGVLRKFIPSCILKLIRKIK